MPTFAVVYPGNTPQPLQVVNRVRLRDLAQNPTILWDTVEADIIGSHEIKSRGHPIKDHDEVFG
jgi:hypothetical protein